MSAQRRTPNRHLSTRQPPHRRNRLIWVAVVVLIAIVAAGSIAYKESRMAHRNLVRMFAAVGIVSSGGTEMHAAPPAQALSVPPTSIGLNLAPLGPARRARAFANLAAGSVWQSMQPKSPQLDPEDVDKDGNLKHLPADRPVFRILNQPGADTKSATIRCTWNGRGAVKVTGKGGGASGGNGSLSFQWTNSGDYKDSNILLQVSALDAANPLRDLDCRETTMPRTARYDPAFVAMLRGFRTIRFMDWQNTNNNRPITWNMRHGEGALDTVQGDGVAIEDMLALVREVGSDAWFNMPWNADDDYVERFARLVHDNLPPNRVVYVELANEVWNAGFSASRQALAEGQTAGLSQDQEKARAFRYAQKLQHVMDIWSKVFADHPSRLVRVANWQNGGNRSADMLAYSDTYNHIDALATAPYFGADFHAQPPATADEAFARVNESMDASLDRAIAAKRAAAKYGKRYIAYEAGQHIVLKDDVLEAQIERDPRMYDAYKRYLSIWHDKIGDTIMMFTSVMPVLKWGGWGLLEYSGQPLSDAPKMRAVREALQQQ